MMSARSTSLNLSSDDEAPRQPRRAVAVSPHIQHALKREETSPAAGGSSIASVRNAFEPSNERTPLASSRLSGLPSERSAAESVPVSARPLDDLDVSGNTTGVVTEPTNKRAANKMPATSARTPPAAAPRGDAAQIEISRISAISPARSKTTSGKPFFKAGIDGGSPLDRPAPSPVHMKSRPTHPLTLAEVEDEAARKSGAIVEEEAGVRAMVVRAARKGLADTQRGAVIRQRAVDSPMFKRMQEIGQIKRSEVEERERQLEKQREADESFHPDLTQTRGRKPDDGCRDPETYFEVQMEWARRKEERLEGKRAEKANWKDVELTGHPTMSPVSEAIIRALREESKANKEGSPNRMLHTSYTEGWAERLAERERKLNDLKARYQPSFKPQTTQYVPDEPSEVSIDTPEGETRDQRLYRIAHELKLKREMAQKAAVPATNCHAKPKEEIDAFLADMLKRTADAQRRKYFKIKRLQREALKIENNGSKPKTNANSSELAASFRKRLEERAAKESEPVEYKPPASNIIKTAPRRTEAFLIHQEKSRLTRKETLERLEAEKEAEFASQYTFAPRITSKSRALAAQASSDQDRLERGPSFLDPTAAHFNRQSQVEDTMAQLYTRKAEEEMIIGKPLFVVGTSNAPSKHITVPGAHQAAILNRERAKRLADRHYQDMIEGRPFKDYTAAELEEIAAALQDGFLDGDVHVDEAGQAYYVDGDGEAVPISAEEEKALMEEMQRIDNSPERMRKHQPRSTSPWEDKYGTVTPPQKSSRTPKSRKAPNLSAPSKVDPIGTDLQEDPVDEETATTPRAPKQETKSNSQSLATKKHVKSTSKMVNDAKPAPKASKAPIQPNPEDSAPLTKKPSKARTATSSALAASTKSTSANAKTSTPKKSKRTSEERERTPSVSPNAMSEQEVEEAIEEGFFEGNVEVDEGGQAWYIGQDGEKVPITAEEHRALLDEMKRLTPPTSPERSHRASTKKAPKEKKDKSSKRDNRGILAQKEQEANDLLEKWKGLA